MVYLIFISCFVSLNIITELNSVSQSVSPSVSFLQYSSLDSTVRVQCAEDPAGVLPQPVHQQGQDPAQPHLHPHRQEYVTNSHLFSFV